MSTVAEITNVLPNLSTGELQQVERALISIYRQRKTGILYDDAYGVWTEEDQMAVADQTLLATATPIVAADFGGLHDTSWIATAYLLTNAVTVPVYGRLGDRHGRREMLFVALGIYVLGAIVCGVVKGVFDATIGSSLAAVDVLVRVREE